jgi:hypothetical protein
MPLCPLLTNSDMRDAAGQNLAALIAPWNLFDSWSFPIRTLA